MAAAAGVLLIFVSLTFRISFDIAIVELGSIECGFVGTYETV